MKRMFVLVPALLAGLFAGAPAGAFSERHPGEGEVKKQDVDVRDVTVKLLDLALLDQDGRKVKFRSDVVGDRIVAIDFIYTNCPVVCPILSSIFADLQNSLGDGLNRDVFLVSVSVDPVTDIPPRLKEYGERYDAKPGWTFLTGEKPSVDQVLAGLGAYAADYTDHSTMILVGDGRSGKWTRFYNFPSSDLILERINQLRAARRAGSGTGKPSGEKR